MAAYFGGVYPLLFLIAPITLLNQLEAKKHPKFNKSPLFPYFLTFRGKEIANFLADLTPKNYNSGYA